MKNLRSLVLMIICAGLLINFSEIAIAETDPKIEYQNLQARKYKDLQTELIYLLGRSVEEKDPNKGTAIGTRIMANLKQTNSSLDELAQLTPDDATKKELSTLNSILSFKSLSDPIQVAKIQESLNLPDKSKIFDKSTYEALKVKIEATGKNIALASSNPESNPTWFLPYLISLLSTIGTSAAIFFVWNHNQKSRKKVNNQLNTLKTEFNSKIDRLESQNSTLSTNFNNQQISIESIRSLKVSTKQSPSFTGNQEPYNIITRPIREAIPVPPSPLSPPRQSSLVDEYNQDPIAFKNRRSVQEVGEEQQNIEGRRSGQIKTVNLSPMERRRGGYWVLSHERQQIIVPSVDIKVNEYNLDTTEAIFDCINFSPSYRKILLIQPATVEMVSSSYQVVSKGRIEFE